MTQSRTQKKVKTEHVKVIQMPWKKSDDEVNCVDCATSCQSACKTSCTVGNIPCEKRR